MVQLRYDQGDTGVVGESRQDVVLGVAITVAAIGAVGTPVFKFTHRPVGSTATFSGAGASRTFTLNVVGNHDIRITDDNGSTEHTVGARTPIRDLAIPAHNEDASADANQADADPTTWVEESHTNQGNSFEGWHPSTKELYEAVEQSRELGPRSRDLDIDSTSDATLETKTSIDIPDKDGTWQIEAKCKLSVSNTNAKGRTMLANITDAPTISLETRDNNKEVKDSANVESAQNFTEFTNTKGSGIKTIALRFALASGSGTVSISDAHLDAYKVA